MSSKNLIRASVVFDVIGCSEEKQGLENRKDRKLYFAPVAFKSFLFFSPQKSYQPVWPITIIDFSDKDIVEDIYHVGLHP